MQVDINQRKEFLERAHAAPGLRLGQGEPISIHVEQVVVGTTRRPIFHAFRRNATRLRFDAIQASIAVHEPCAPVGILQRINHHDRIRQHPAHYVIMLCGEQVIRG